MIRILFAPSSPLARFYPYLVSRQEAFHAIGRRSMLRFSPLGKIMLAAYMVSLMYVVNTRSSVNYQLFSLLLVLLSAAVILGLSTRARAAHFRFSRTLPKYLSAQRAFTYSLRIRNNSPKPQADVRVVERIWRERPESCAPNAPNGAMERLFHTRWRRLEFLKSQAMIPETQAPRLSPGESVERKITFAPGLRGLYRFAPTTLAVPDPLGLFRALLNAENEQTLVVLPTTYPTPRIELPGGRKHQPGGLMMASSVGETGEFVSLREYRPGDPVRHIHWRSWARHGKPIVKEFQDEFFTRHALILDTFPNHKTLPGADDLECFEAAVSVAGSFVVMDRSQDTLLDLLFVGDRAHLVTAGRGLAQDGLLLEVLASVAPCWGREFSSLRDTVLAHAEKVSGAICVFLDWDAPRQELVHALLAQGVTPLVFIVRPQNPKELQRVQALGAGPLAGRETHLKIVQPATIQQTLSELAGL